MDLYLGQTKDIILGQDFLTWLWFRSEVNQGRFQGPDGLEFFVFVERRISVQGGEGESLETATVSGAMSELREARIGLSTGKKVNKALIRIEVDPEVWQGTLKADDFSLSGLRTPKVEAGQEEGDDPDAPFFEKIYLLERFLELLDYTFNLFLDMRLGPGWNDEVAQFRAWLEQD